MIKASHILATLGAKYFYTSQSIQKNFFGVIIFTLLKEIKISFINFPGQNSISLNVFEVVGVAEGDLDEA
ncbi:hypothetical protein ES705_49002 [subsurface metagenome]